MMFSTLLAVVFSAVAGTGAEPFDVRFAQTYSNHLVKVDADYLAKVFTKHEETNLWQTEFWGKYMHSAVPLVKRYPNAELERHIRSSAAIIMDSQQSDGYIGNYRADKRGNGGWDVWGVKYTLMGLLYYHDLTHEERPLACAKKLADWLIREVGPGGKRRIVTTGNYCGMPSCSVLEPIVWLYRETKDARYLAFAAEIVREVGFDADGPRLVTQALEGIPVAARGKWTGPWWDGCKDNAMKAYEMMSCYQGMLEYVEEKVKAGGQGQEVLEKIRRAALMSAEDILAHEINIVGGAGSVEFWYGGAADETHPYAHQNETCVTITWMRLCQKLYSLTKDEKWLAAFRRTFFNVYLGAISPDCSRFAAYPALQGRRTFYREHCHMTTDCCNQNGMRGYVAALDLGVIAGETPEKVHATKDPRGDWRLVEKDGSFAVCCGELVMSFTGDAAAIPIEREEFDLEKAKSTLVPFAAVGANVYRTWAEVIRHPWTGKLASSDPVVLQTAKGRVEIALKGGRILSWRPTGGREVFFMPEKPIADNGDWCHGGMPVCWPWFGRKDGVIHGFVRDRLFSVAARSDEKDRASVTLVTDVKANEYPSFPHAARLELVITLADRLTLAVRTTNTGAQPFTYSEGVHPYFGVLGYAGAKLAGVDEKPFAVVDGMDKAFVRREGALTLAEPDRRLTMAACGNSHVVVWSPGTVEPPNRNLRPGDPSKFVAVGPFCSKTDGAVTLAPGKSHELVFELACTSH